LSYWIKEIFYSLQGEGFHVGRPAVFCRFSGCNLWSGKKSDQQRAICKFCDTDFLGCDGQAGGRYSTAELLVKKIGKFWPRGKGIVSNKPFVVLTGGEPLLQLDDRLLSFLHERGWEVAVETNGTLLPPEGIDWLCVSPKAGTELVVHSGEELKLVFPQRRAMPEKYEHLHFKYFFLQPLDRGRKRGENTQRALQYVLAHPQWCLSLQLQKILKIP
jgi:7-carboxy-7-deazaguanine synthase (Cx14CxxC type)